MRDYEHPILSAAAGSPLPAAFYRVFRERSPALLALLQVAFGGNGQGGGTITTITGVSPLTLANSLAKPIRSLVQYGKCVQSGGSIYCNNGAIQPITEGASTQGGTPSMDNYVPVVGVESGNAELQGIGTDVDYIDAANEAIVRAIGAATLTGNETFGKSSSYGAAFYINGAASGSSWGANRGKAVLCTHFVGTEPGTSTMPVGTCFFNASGHFYFRVEDNSDTATFKAWLSAQYAAGTPVMVYYVRSTPASEPWDGTASLEVVGTPEVLTISATGETAQTVTDIPDLFATLDGSVRDEVDLVSGVLTRRTEPSYKNGAVVIRALATPVTEQTTPHELRSFAGDTTVSWTAAVSGTEKRVEYAQEASTNPAFVPSGSDGLLTADGKIFRVRS